MFPRRLRAGFAPALFTFAGFAAALVAPPASQAQTTYTYATVDDANAPAGSVGTQLFDVNDAGQAIGKYLNSYYGLGASFLYTPGTGGGFATIAYPGATGDTNLVGLNNGGEVVGNYQLGNSAYGFLDNGGVFSTISDPLATGANGTEVHGIDNNGDIVGNYFVGNSTSETMHGFVDTNGIFTTVDPVPTALNNETTLSGINDSGQIAGYYYDATAKNYRGFLDTGGVITPIGLPSAEYTYVYGLNDKGDVIGYSYLAQGGTQNVYSFVYSAGVYSVLNYPLAGSFGTEGLGINDAGQVAGQYITPSLYHGFIATPNTITPPAAVPESGVWALLALGLPLCGVAVRRRRA